MKKEFHQFLLIISVISYGYCRILSSPVNSLSIGNVFQIFNTRKHISIIRTNKRDDYHIDIPQNTNLTIEIFDTHIDDGLDDECLNMNRFVSINDHFNYVNDENMQQYRRTLTQEKFEIVRGFFA